jgi:atypical dual specificity phosphatase
MPGNFSFVIPGKLAGCAKPGGGLGNPRSDLTGLSRQGIGAVVSLTEEKLDPAALRDTGLRSLHLPVPDFQPPTRAQIGKCVTFIDACLADGLAVAVHCGAGYGRTGAMLACYLVSAGQKPAEAVKRIRALRPGSIETPEQERCVADYHKSLKTKTGKNI